jgi:hypothetical protein
MPKRDILSLSLILVIAAAVLHLVHFLIFHDAHQMLFYLVGDIAFLPLEVLFVTIIVDRMLASREAMSRRHKMNMVIGVFFSDLGRTLLSAFRPMLQGDAEHCAPCLQLKTSQGDLQAAIAAAAAHAPSLQVTVADLNMLRGLLHQHEQLLLQLLANPVLLEHEEFADALWAIQHLEEELAAREDLSASPPSDLAHLRKDAERAYGRLLHEWLEYLLHLKQYYPYLFSFEVRADPLAPERTIQVLDA